MEADDLLLLRGRFWLLQLFLRSIIAVVDFEAAQRGCLYRDSIEHYVQFDDYDGRCDNEMG